MSRFLPPKVRKRGGSAPVTPRTSDTESDISPLIRYGSKLQRNTVKTSQIQVAVRVRPFSQNETNCSNCIDINNTKNQLTIHSKDGISNSYEFDKIFDMDSTQDDVFQICGLDIINGAFEGYNGCILAYGQTGSGKTHTMVGSAETTNDIAKTTNDIAKTTNGLIPQMLTNIFERINSAEDSKDYCVTISYLEIYAEKIRDLLDFSAKNASDRDLAIRSHPTTGIYVENLKKMAVTDQAESMLFLNQGNTMRATATTNMNQRSSRSHAIFTIELTKTVFIEMNGERCEKEKITSKINLVDLAGSERVASSGVTGINLNEAKAINTSLSHLTHIISTMVSNQKRINGGGKPEVVQFRNSKLTRLLEESIGGNSRTFMIAAISPADKYYQPTISTLRYAESAKQIKNNIKINRRSDTATVKLLQQEIDTLREELSKQTKLGSGEEISRLREEVTQREKILEDMKQTWEEKLAATVTAKEELHKVLEETKFAFNKLSEEHADLVQHVAVLDEQRRTEVAVIEEKVQNSVEQALTQQMIDLRCAYEKILSESLEEKDREIEKLEAKWKEAATKYNLTTIKINELTDEISRMKKLVEEEKLSHTQSKELYSAVINENLGKTSSIDDLKRELENTRKCSLQLSTFESVVGDLSNVLKSAVDLKNSVVHFNNESNRINAEHASYYASTQLAIGLMSEIDCSLKRDVEMSNEIISNQQSEICKLKREIEESNQLINQFICDKKIVDERVLADQQEINTLCEQIKKLEEENKQLSLEYDELNDQLVESMKTNTDKIEEMKVIANKMDDLKNEDVNIDAENEDLKFNLAFYIKQTSAEIASANGYIKDLESQKDKLVGELKDRNDEISQLRNLLERLQMDHSGLFANLTDKDKALLISHSDYEKLRQIHERQVRKVKGVIEAFKDVQKKSLKKPVKIENFDKINLDDAAAQSAQ
jgi:hypothetical protein